MKIIIIISSLSSGGAERVTANLANAWASRGWDVTIVTFASADLDFYSLNQSVNRVALNLASDSANIFQAIWANFRRLLALRRVLREKQPHLVLGMMVTASIIATLAGKGLSCRVVVSERIHPPRLPIGRIWNFLRRHVYPLATKVIALTDESSQWLQTHVPGCSVVVIPNPVLFPIASVEPILAPDQIVLKQRRFLLAVGRLAEQKGFDYLIKSFAVIPAKHPDWELIILGEGPKRLELEALVKHLGLSHCVKLPGRAGNVTDWYQKADLYVMSSLFEGFPNTLVEAMAHGCPVISFDCDTGPRDIIRHEIDGLLVPVGNIPALTASLDQLITDADLRTQYSIRAVEAQNRFSLKQILSLWDRLFEEVLDKYAK
ncbi:MAG: glycosyltransferase family 4 protein [Candidatus Competibacter sp.]